MGTLGPLFGLPIDFSKGILKVNSEVPWSQIGSIMSDYGVICVALWGYFESTLGSVEWLLGPRWVVFWGIFQSTPGSLEGYFRVLT